jgi:hypothetical protein
LEKEKEQIFLLTEFTYEALKEFHSFSEQEGTKVIFLSSTGGALSVAVGFLDIINRNPKEYNIRISEYVMSSALLLIRYALCPVEDVSTQYSVDTFFLWHSTQAMHKYDKTIRKATLEADKKEFESIRHVLTEKQIRKVVRFFKLLSIWKYFGVFLNNDTYLTRSQIKMLLKERYNVRKR